MSRRLFVDQVVFRIFGPFISGLVIYLLILLLYNNIEHILENFLSEELLICIGFAILISETSRQILKTHQPLRKKFPESTSLALVCILSIMATVIIILLGLHIYYNYKLGYDPNTTELQIFLVLYVTFNLVFVTFFMSNHFLHEAYKRRLKNSENQRKQSKEHFVRFTRGINTELLFESLETIITYDRQDKEKADEIIDDLSLVYRYTLTKNLLEVISVDQELTALDSFVDLVDHLPYRSISIENKIRDECHVIPGTLLFIVEQVIKSTISGIDEQLSIKLYCDEKFIVLEYVHIDKLTNAFTLKKLNELNHSYQIYSDDKIVIENVGKTRLIKIPKLILEN